MRELADAERIRRFMRALGREADEGGNAYFTGGATAVLVGWRRSTIDVDLSLIPESDRVLRRLPRIKDELAINVELASPADFIPVPAGWEERSVFISREGNLSFHHFDLYAQALAKVERAHRQDLEDVREPRGVQAVPVESRTDLGEPAIALTFDDGPSEWTSPILDVLRDHEVRATLFVIGENIAGNEEIVRRLDREGHEVGNHTLRHPHLDHPALGSGRDPARAHADQPRDRLSARGEPARRGSQRWPRCARSFHGCGQPA